MRGSAERIGRVRARSKAAILAAATSVFAERGLNAPTAEVAVRSGLSKGLIFGYFGSKEGLLAAAAEHWLRQSYAYLLAGDWPDDPALQLARILDESVAFVSADPGGYRLIHALRLDPSCSDMLRTAERAVAPAAALQADRIHEAFRQLSSSEPALDAALFEAALTGLLVRIASPACGPGSEMMHEVGDLKEALLARLLPRSCRQPNGMQRMDGELMSRSGPVRRPATHPS